MVNSTLKVLLGITVIHLALREDVTVQTSLGNITGSTEMVTFDGSTFGITTFLGIPFAEPPIGPLRFSKPKERTTFDDTFVAKIMSPICVQNVEQLIVLGLDPTTMTMDEDCLYLNIYAPGEGTTNSHQKRAVMIWIYGGGFAVGSQNGYDAKALAGLHDVILVTLNYRLSVLGFLSTDEDNLSGNYGLWDQHMAIKWVNTHIESFGGDPQRVTLFGQSAGSASAVYQAMFKGNEGLFQRVILQSGSANSPWAYDHNPADMYISFANKSGCLFKHQHHKSMKVIKCLQDLSIPEITELVGIADEFLPVRDGDFVTMRPTDVFLNATEEADVILKRLKKLDMIIGVNSAEGGALIPMLDFVMGNTQSTTGYSKDALDNFILPFALGKAKMKQSTTLVKSIQHQYFDWSDPGNASKVFHNTVDLLSDILFNAPVTQAALVYSDTKGNGKLFFYVFDHNSLLSDDRLLGAAHIEEVRFVLGFPPSFRTGWPD